ncbi:hypothetical protein BDN72DRAFT_965330 [Pluteus cervinus]|uniref:Uncharacterized protein n=1 Tax=Pluteus cervinus TaxID=181527 RepID=A0ACD3A650_9AGAR|nr:hypothetical protein BDN72DRAFT_965330 [Pluteus cervinus]
MPVLWSRIRVNLNNKGSISIAKTCLSRSHTLSLTLQTERKANTPEAEDFLTFLNDLPILVRYLSADLYEDTLPQGILPFVERHAAYAEELASINTHTLDDLYAPQVQRLFLNGPPRSWTSLGPTGAHVGFPQLLQLTVLHIRWSIPIGFVEVIFGRCPQLQRLHIELDLEDNSFPSHATPNPNSAEQQHDHLEYLSILNRGRGMVPSTFLHQWTFPKLWMLSYEVSVWPLTRNWLISHPLLSRVTNPIINFQNAQHDHGFFLLVLKSAPLVESLVLGGTMGDTVSILTSIPMKSSTHNVQHSSSMSNSTTLLNLRRAQIVFDLHSSWVLRAYGDQLRSLRESWSPDADDPADCNHHLSLLSIEVSSRYSGPQPEEDYLALLSHIQGENQEIKLEHRRDIPSMDIQLLWCASEDPEAHLFGRFWPLPFNRSIPEFRILSGKGEWSTRTGPAYYV